MPKLIGGSFGVQDVLIGVVCVWGLSAAAVAWIFRREMRGSKSSSGR